MHGVWAALWKVARSKHITKPKHMKGSKERLFIRTQTPNMQIFGKIPFAKLQNDTKATVKRIKTRTNQMGSEITYLVWLSCVVFLSSACKNDKQSFLLQIFFPKRITIFQALDRKTT